MRILFADDSSSGRLLVQVYLKGSSHVVTFAEDGVEAIEHFKGAPFDLIFMDLQMPRMDGLTAVGQIRAIEAEQGRTAIPIVALSADRPEDVQIGQNSGFDAYLAKPISRTQLLEAIAQRDASGTSSHPAKASAPVITGGLQGITARYIATRRAETARLLELIESSEFDQIRVAGHNLKGTGGAYGFPMLTTLGAAIESAAKAADVQALHTHLHELALFLDQLSL